MLPAHSSHILQPLDVGCFGPFQKVFATEVDCFMKQNVGQVLNKYNIAKVASNAYVSALSQKNLTSSFQKAGIYPFDATRFDATKLGPNKVWGQKNDITTVANVQPSLSFEEFLPNATNANKTNIVEISNAPKPRNTIHNIVSGKAITEQPVAEKVRAHFKPPLKKSVSGQQNLQRNDFSTTKQAKQAKKCPTCTPSNPSVHSKVRVAFKPPLKDIQAPSTSAIYVSQSPEKNSDDLDSDDDSSVCCVCGLFSPKEMRDKPYIEFVKWAQCDRCSKYCCKALVVRRGTIFLCPCCLNQNES